MPIFFASITVYKIVTMTTIYCLPWCNVFKLINLYDEFFMHDLAKMRVSDNDYVRNYDDVGDLNNETD